MNRKNLLLIASLAFAFAAIPACNSSTTPDGGTTTTSAGSTGGAGSTGAGNGSTGAANNGSTGAGNGSTGGAGSTGGGSSGGTTGAVFPSAPTLGTEIDRVGRPAINTALTDPFDLYQVAPDGGLTEDQAKNLYNATSSPITNPKFDGDGGFIPWIATNLAIIDALDGVCGNQAFASADLDAGPPGNVETVPPGRYLELATVLADDELYIDTTADATTGTCSFLGAELEATATPAVAGNNCGGRQPTEDVIDIEYNLLAIGFGGLPHGDAGFAISNGVQSKATNPANDGTVPYLGAPN